MKRRVVLVGASGVFGSRLAELLVRNPDFELVLAARRPEPLNTLAARLGAEAVVFDRDAPHGLAALRPWAVADAAGPFQSSDLRLAEGAVACGAHYVDLSDGRDFVARFPGALDAAARAAGVLAATGASSTPGLSNAALDRMTAGWASVDRISVAISPGARAPRGLAVTQAILSYVGRPVRVFEGGGWRMLAGWSALRRTAFPSLGRRWTALCETPDLDVLAARFGVRDAAIFRAGLETPLLHLGLWLLSWPVRLGLIRSLTPLARPLLTAVGWFDGFGSDRGGMVAEAEGLGPDGSPRAARWALWAEAGAGPYTPAAPAAAVLEALASGRIAARGAQACVGLVSVDQIMAQLSHLPIQARLDRSLPQSPSLLRRVLGEAVDDLPEPVRRLHAGLADEAFSGRGRARGSRALPATLLRMMLGLPAPGPYPELEVSIAPRGLSEVWTRRFGRRGFTSRLSATGAPGRFEEAFGPIRFAFDAEAFADGFRWRFTGWRIAGLPLPRALAPRIRATTFARNGGYRFRVAVAHPLAGLVFAYAGRLASD